MPSRHSPFALLSAFVLGMVSVLLTLTAQAGRIDPEHVAVEYGPAGLALVPRSISVANLFEFAPFTTRGEKPVPGFSDPLGAGSERGMSVFPETVQNMDVLGDFHPSNPFDPSDVAPTQESLQASYLVSHLLYGAPLPSKEDLVTAQLNLMYSPLSQFSDRPKTIETSPLNLAGFGSVTEKPGPVSLHWTQCPDYALKRYLIARTKEKKASPAMQRNRPRLDCLVI